MSICSAQSDRPFPAHEVVILSAFYSELWGDLQRRTSSPVSVHISPCRGRSASRHQHSPQQPEKHQRLQGPRFARPPQHLHSLNRGF